MQFDFQKRQAEFGVWNNRRENEGQEKAKVKAIDLPIRIQIKPRELDMLVPTNGIALSMFLFGDDLRKPELQTHLLSPMPVYRKPEHVKISIYDDGVDKRKVLTFDDCKVKDPKIEFDQDAIFLNFKAQIHPGKHLQRINDNVESQTRFFECKATQPELFDAAAEDGEEGAQADMVGKGTPPADDDDDDE